jgi:hypothetical protein
MIPSTISSISLIDLVAAAFRLPLFSLIVASLIAAGVALAASRLRDERSSAALHTETVVRSVAARYLPERRALGIGAIAVIVVFAVENVVRGYLLNLADIVEWWQYATPVFAACLCLTVVLGLIVFRGTTPPEQPVVSATRRTWTSFSASTGIIGAGVALVALFGTTIVAGLASSADERGRYIYLDIPVPNASIDPLRPWFYGWSFGVPVILCLAVLGVVSWLALRGNAVRPFLRPETVTAEQVARVEIASGIARIATAGLLLALAGAWRFIARAGSISQLVIEGEGGSESSYETTWRYAEFAIAAGWLAPALEVTAFVLLLLVASRLRRMRALELSTERVEHMTDPETVR